MGFPNKSFFFLFLHCIFILLLPFHFVSPTSSMALPHTQNITLGSSLTATEHNTTKNDSYWSSQSGDFAFGFRSLGSTQGFLLAIWFNNIPQKTIVWSANRDNLAPKGSTIQLTSRGQLVLNDPAGNQIWKAITNSSDSVASYASMLDTGNFVLAAPNSSYEHFLWQSFDEPTDTILPSQIMKEGTNLVASHSKTNSKSGRFQLWMQTDGNLVLYPRQYPLDIYSKAYWASRTVGSESQLVFNLSGSIYLRAKNNSMVKSLMQPITLPSTQNSYLRAIIEYDGIFRLYSYPNTPDSSSSSNEWSQVLQLPQSLDICTVGDRTGNGVCGLNSYCMLGDDQRPTCVCAPGYDLLDSNDELKGCKPTFVSQSCDQSFPETDQFQLVTMDNLDFNGGFYGVSQPVNEDWCRRFCMSDCFCAVAIFREGTCWIKKFPFSFGRFDIEQGGKALIKIRKENSTFKPNDPLVEKQRNKSTIIVIGSVLLGSSVFLNFILTVLTLFIAFRLTKRKSNTLKGDPLTLGVNLRIFSYEELNKATGGFTEQLGRGSFATVYKGIIDSADNNSVAIKKLDNVVQEGDQEFKAEVSAIARTNHKNLVRLLGFCNEGEYRMLVYEFMPNGSLAGYLFGTSKPNWNDRIPIVLGIARGLRYLHEECSTQTIHCDIKPQNILLDDCFTARIADFGLAKLLRKDQTQTLTAIRGTKGYVAPEWFRSLPITTKVDVYSFGILLLELICCRRSFEEKAECEDRMVLADWAYDCFKEGKVEMLVENDEEAKVDMERVKKFVKVAIWCIQEEPSLRPTMKKVVQMLEGAIEVSFPPDPSSFISTIP